MNSAGIVVLAILGGAFVVILVAGMVLLGLALWYVKKAVAELLKTVSGNSAEMKTSIEGAKSSFSAIRTEMTRQQADFLKETRDLLANHASLMAGEISKINASALAEASIRAVQACGRMEKMAVALEKVILSVDAQTENNLGPEEYAPDDGTSYYDRSDVARGDSEAQAEDSQGSLSLG